MPLLVYSYPAFIPNTVIQSAKVNAKFTDISTLLNTTKLDDTNLQDAGITRATKLKLGTANHVVINSGTGAMSSEAALSPTRGGLGISITLVPGDSGKVPQVNAAGSAFELTSPPESPGSKIFNLSRFI